MLDSTAYPHIIERIIDLAPFAVRVHLRLVSKKVCARVDRLLWTHIAYGRSKHNDLVEFCEPFPPWNRLPGPRPDDLCDFDMPSDDEHLPWYRDRVVDWYGAETGYGLNFGDATVRCMRPTDGTIACESIVDYITLPSWYRSLHFVYSALSERKRNVLRVLVDIAACELPGMMLSMFDWSPALRDLRTHANAIDPIERLAVVFEVRDSASRVDTPAEPPVPPSREDNPPERHGNNGILHDFDGIVSVALQAGTHVTVAGLERIPPFVLDSPPMRL